MKTLWYNFFKLYIKTGLFFYTKKIKVVGKENIPKKGAVLFVVNHPNGLLDPLLVTTNTPRITYYLVRAAVFKKPIVKKFLATLNLMPIYRIRDGVKELSKNTKVFNDCYKILHHKRALMIFAEGSHDKRRTVRPLSKGFTRILFGTLEKYPNTKIHVIPVGITYQKVGQYPCKVAIHYGKSIIANEYYSIEDPNKAVTSIKDAVSNQLKELSVHIPADENYESIIQKLNSTNVDFTEIATIQNKLQKEEFHQQKATINFIKPVYYLLVLNSIFPWIIWKMLSKKIDETEFIDTFRFGAVISVFPFFYAIQTYLIYVFFDLTLALLYAILTLSIALAYSKFSTTPTE